MTLRSARIGPGRWRLVVAVMGERPPTNNAILREPHRARYNWKQWWRDSTQGEADHAKVPAMGLPVAVEAMAVYPTRRGRLGRLPDTEAHAICLKWCLDGLVIARVIPDDTAEHVHRVTLHAPAIVEGAPDPGALIIGITPAHGPTGPATLTKGD